MQFNMQHMFLMQYSLMFPMLRYLLFEYNFEIDLIYNHI